VGTSAAAAPQYTVKENHLDLLVIIATADSSAITICIQSIHTYTRIMAGNSNIVCIRCVYIIYIYIHIEVPMCTIIITCVDLNVHVPCLSILQREKIYLDPRAIIKKNVCNL